MASFLAAFGGPVRFWNHSNSNVPGLQQLRRRGLVGEFVSIYEDEGIACSVRIRGSCWKKSRCRMGKNRCVIWKELTWLELICRRLACNFCGIRWGTVVQTVDHCCRWHATIHPRKTRPTEPCPVSEWTIFLSCKVHLHDPCWLVAKDVETTGRGRYVLCRLLAARCGWMGSLAWNDAFWMEDDGRNLSISNLIRS